MTATFRFPQPASDKELQLLKEQVTFLGTDEIWRERLTSLGAAGPKVWDLDFRSMSLHSARVQWLRGECRVSIRAERWLL